MQLGSLLAEIPPSVLPLELLAPAGGGRAPVVAGAPRAQNPMQMQQSLPSEFLTKATGNPAEPLNFANLLQQINPTQAVTASPQALTIDRAEPPRLPPTLPDGSSNALQTAPVVVSPSFDAEAEGGKVLPADGKTLPQTPPRTNGDQETIQPAAVASGETPPPPLLNTASGVTQELTRAAELNAAVSAPAAKLTLSQTPASPAPNGAAAPPGIGPGEAAGLEADSSGEFNFGQRQQSEGDGRGTARDLLSGADFLEASRRELQPRAASSGMEQARTEANPGTHLTTPQRLFATESSLLQTSTSLSLPADRAQFSEPLAQRIALMVQQGQSSADIRLNPPHLGRLEVQLTLNGDQASIVLNASTPEIREALQQSLPRLETLLQNSGLQLADAEVTDQSAREAQQQTRGGMTETTPDNAEPQPTAQRITQGLIDTYA